MIKKVYRVEGMLCSNCAMSVEGIEDDLPGIRQVSASYQKANMSVEFEEQLVSEEQILSALVKRGYRAYPV
jgi:copper chaperone CopZ